MNLVDIRCQNWDDALWAYVVENARVRKVTRCEALQLIVKEHMQFMADAQQRKLKELKNVRGK